METIGKIRRRHKVNNESISSIGRDLNLSRNTVKKYLKTSRVDRLPNLPPSLRPALILSQGPFPPPALPGFHSTTGPSAILDRQALPSPTSCWRHPPPQPRTSRVACALPLSRMPLPIPRHGYQVHVSLTSPVVSAFPASTGRSARASPFSRLAQRSLTLRPACLPRHLVSLCTRGFSHFVTSMTAPIASGWSESRRVGFASTGKAPPLHGARRTRGPRYCRKFQPSKSDRTQPTKKGLHSQVLIYHLTH